MEENWEKTSSLSRFLANEAGRGDTSTVSVYSDHQQALENYEFQMGVERGRLSLTLDLLTDALVLVGQHGVYCQSARQPGKPALDVQMISKQIEDAKQLVRDVMMEMRRKSQPVVKD